MNILVVKTSSIGDIIQAFPVLEYLKSRFPEASIDWVVENEYQQLVGAHPFVQRVICFGSRQWRRNPLASSTHVRDFFKTLRQKKYDLLFDLQGNTKSSLITAAARANEKIGLGWKSVPEFPNYFSTQKHVEIDQTSQIQHRYLQIVQGYFEDDHLFIPKGVSLALAPEEENRLQALILERAPRIMVACNSKWPNKTLSAATLKELLSKIASEDQPYFYFVWGTEAEKKEADELALLFQGQSVGRLSFPLWQALMREMELVISTDSAALALCGTTKTPSLSFFGPSLATIYRPLGEQHVAWQGSCPYGKQFHTRCPILRSCKTGACLKSASSEALFNAYLSRSKNVKSM